MEAVNGRGDFSRFLVHLTKDTPDGKAKDNLLSIIEDSCISARNNHCLFGPVINNGGYSDILKKQFNTVCFTEIPLPEIKNLVRPIAGRKIELKPYGLVFWRDLMIEAGANPAVYVNAKGTELRKFLLQQFRDKFDGVETYRGFKSEEEWHEEIIHYYSLINIIADNHDFSWEREWRVRGDLSFKRRQVAAIIAEDPEPFEKYCKQKLSKEAFEFVQYTVNRL